MVFFAREAIKAKGIRVIQFAAFEKQRMLRLIRSKIKNKIKGYRLILILLSQPHPVIKFKLIFFLNIVCPCDLFGCLVLWFVIRKGSGGKRLMLQVARLCISLSMLPFSVFTLVILFF